ncbi:hypothetical protein ACVBEH_10210 [Roseateles sp. GG27B]
MAALQEMRAAKSQGRSAWPLTELSTEPALEQAKPQVVSLPPFSQG